MTDKHQRPATETPWGPKYKRVRWIVFVGIVAATLALWLIVGGPGNARTRTSASSPKAPAYERIEVGPIDAPDILKSPAKSTFE